MSRNKYGNKKITINGETFDSRKEYNRFFELSVLARVGKISNLRRQVEFVLIPKQKGERECKYIADFVYYDNDARKTVVEDTKGMRTRDYIIKRKLMLWVHNIKIKEV